MPDLEAPEPDAVDEEQSPVDSSAAPVAPSRDPEAPEVDALEQAEPVVGGASITRESGALLDANEADVHEQMQEAAVEDDDYDR